MAGTARYQYSSHPPPEPVAYTSATMRSLLRGVVSVGPSGPAARVSTRSGTVAGFPS